MEDIRLVPYRDFWALERGKTLCYCPETGEPCSSKCLFFRITKYDDTKGIYNIIITCRSAQFFISIGEK